MGDGDVRNRAGVLVTFRLDRLSVSGVASDWFLLGNTRQEDRQETEQRQVGADPVDEIDAVGIGETAE